MLVSGVCLTSANGRLGWGWVTGRERSGGISSLLPRPPQGCSFTLTLFLSLGPHLSGTLSQSDSFGQHLLMMLPLAPSDLQVVMLPGFSLGSSLFLVISLNPIVLTAFLLLCTYVRPKAQMTPIHKGVYSTRRP